MAGESDLGKLLASMSPVLIDEEFVFFSSENVRYGDHANLAPVATVAESEGLTLATPKSKEACRWRRKGDGGING
jgi:hypothetical protein